MWVESGSKGKTEVEEQALLSWNESHVVGSSIFCVFLVIKDVSEKLILVLCWKYVKEDRGL